MTQQSPKPSQPNPQLTEAEKLITSALAGGAEAHSYFRELMQLLLSLTVLAPGQSVRLYYGGTPDKWVISGQRRKNRETAAEGRELFEPLRLTNGNYLYLFYDNYTDHADQGYLKTLVTKLAYQLDFDGHRQMFRFDHNRVTDSQYPFAHLHVYGTWQHATTGLKDLDKIHFPVVRPSIEGMIRLLINEFGVTTNSDASTWLPVLDHTERRFFEVARKRAQRQ